MRRTLLIVLTIVTFYNAKAQKQLLTQKLSGESQVNIALEETRRVFTPPPVKFSKLKSGTTSGNFNVTYENFPEEAKSAFQYAISIWESIITSPVQINILAKWETLDANMLALGKPTQFYKNFDGANVANVYYPVALVEKLAEKEMNGADEPDIICSFNKGMSWYFGTDGNTPSSKYDLTTAVLHEITHGLGFSGFFKVENESGFINNQNNLPSIYDYFIFNNNDLRISDDENYPCPSNELFQQFISENLKFNLLVDNQNSNNIIPNVYAPANWKAGSSLYHLDHNNFDSDDENSLMAAYKYKGEAVHSPGDLIIEMLSEMGWKTISFNFDVIKDFEETSDQLPIVLGINSEIPFDSTSIKIIFSKDYFTTKDSVSLTYNNSIKQFVGNLPINNHLGNIQYYFVACNSENKTYSLPGNAPDKKLCFRIGPDYSPPSVQHNPVKLISKTINKMKLTATANDNVGVKSVIVEYKLDGILQEPFNLTIDSDDSFSGTIEFPDQFMNQNKIEYRIVVDDKSINENEVTLPSSGYFSVNVFESVEPVKSYETDFNFNNDDFITADFEISKIAGFSNGILHTQHPYPVSALENEKYNLITQLKTPIILEEYGQMTFNEVVLVEPGEPESDYTDLLFWDYVIVEGSKDQGKTWLPLTSGYDSNLENDWYSSFTNSLNSNFSTNTGNENMLVERTIYLTENTGFNAGDTVIFRFRLSSDNSVNGWGWGIDDLKIQNISTEEDEIFSEEHINVYPNPFAESFFVDCSNANDVATVDILITDLMGKTVFRENWTNPQFDTKKQINLNDIKPGIYLVNMVTDASRIITQKIVKY